MPERTEQMPLRIRSAFIPCSQRNHFSMSAPSVDARNFYRKKRYLIPAILLVALIAFRLYLPTLVKNYVNKTLANLPGYYGQVDDIDIALIRGAYVINGLYLNVVEEAEQVPFLKLPKTDISVEWKSIFRGRIVSEIYLYSPEMIYLLENQTRVPAETTPTTEDWSKALTELVPISINHLEISDGKLAYVEVNAEPNIDLQINKLKLLADNLSNVVAEANTLPSSLTASGVSIGGGNMQLDGKLNMVKEIPDADLTFSLLDVDATALNDWTNQYVGIDFESGTFAVTSEIAIADGLMKGYVKPLLKEGKMIGKDDSFTQKIWEGFLGFFKFIFQNQKTRTLATEVPLEGDLNNPAVGVVPTIFNIFENAWINAFTAKPDESVDYEDALNLKNGKDMTKKEKRQARRAKRKAEKKKEKEEEKDKG